jgi:hypothetical protein
MEGVELNKIVLQYADVQNTLHIRGAKALRAAEF